MPARIVLVHDDLDFAEEALGALKSAGHNAALFVDSMGALNALDAAETVELLITRVRFGPGKPHGIALARMARLRRSRIQVLFVAAADTEEHTEGLGEFLPMPVSVGELMKAVERRLEAAAHGDG